MRCHPWVVMDPVYRARLKKAAPRMGWNELIGNALDQYEILGELGRGGSSRVYRARDTRTAQIVAIKVIPNDAEDRQTFVHRFEREVEAIRLLHHPNIISILDAGKTEEFVYLAMQCISGGTLRSLLGRPLTPTAAVDYIIQMALALHHAHLQGIVHRDVKPSNMLLDDTQPGHLLLTDFGTAKIQGARGLTKSGTTVGTPEYMSPEQAEGREIDQRSDIYALGCVLYESLAGRPPFIGATPVSVLYQQVHTHPAYLRGLNPDVPRDLAQVIEIALAKRPADRFPNAAVFAERLAPFASLAATDAASDGVPGMHVGAPDAASTRDAQGFGAPDMPGIAASSVLSDEATLVPLDRQALFAVSVPGGEDAEAATVPPGIIESVTQPRVRVTYGPVLTQQPTAASGMVPGADSPTLPAADSPTLPRRRPTRTTHSPAPLRLPSKLSAPLNQSLSVAGEQAIAAFMTQAERVGADDTADTVPLVRSAPRGAPALWQGTTGPAPASGVSPRGTGPVADRVPAPRARRTTVPVLRAPAADRRRPTAHRLRVRQREHPRAWAVALAASVLLCLSALGWLGAAVMGHAARPSKLPQAHATHAATYAPRVTAPPTATARPTAVTTATTDIQQALNAQAAASFRGATVGAGPDGSCAAANATNQFSFGQPVYINLCTAPSVAAGPMTVVIRQGGAVIFTLVSNRYLSPSASYFYYSNYPLAPGTYDMLVTIALQGQTAIARDLVFQVG